MTKAKEGQPFSNGIPPNYHPFFSDRFVMIILFSLQSSFILSPTQNPSVCNHCPSNLICGIVLSDLLIFPYTVNVLSFLSIFPLTFFGILSQICRHRPYSTGMCSIFRSCQYPRQYHYSVHSVHQTASP